MATATPTGLKLTPGVNSIAASWNVSGEGLGGQLLHYRAKGTTSWTTVELKSTVRSYAIMGLQAEGYEIQVRALVAGGLASANATPLAPAPPVEPPKTNFLKGWNGGGWGSAELANLKAANATCVRLENPADTLSYSNNGQKVVYLFGSYQSGGVKSINVGAWVAQALTVVRAHSDIWAFEALNEPGGNWFWGSGAESAENAAAYCRLLKALREAFTKEFGSKAPLIFASFDGGHAGDNTWGKHMLAADPNVSSYVDAFTEHCYDGSDADPAKTLVRFRAVEEAHRLTGKLIAITEYGRPTISGTGDSPKSTPEQQAKALAAMIHASREAGYVSCVCVYGYRDGKGAQGYGVYNENDSPKPAVAAIAGV